MKKAFYRIVAPVRKLYWFTFRPKTKGVKVVVWYHEKLLMIKNSYGKKIWTFPGGAIERNESPEDAARREVLEEVGLEVFGMKSVGKLLSTREYKRDSIYCYTAITANRQIVINSDEIEDARWFSMDELPLEISSIAKEILSFPEL